MHRNKEPTRSYKKVKSNVPNSSDAMPSRLARFFVIRAGITKYSLKKTDSGEALCRVDPERHGRDIRKVVPIFEQR